MVLWFFTAICYTNPALHKNSEITAIEPKLRAESRMTTRPILYFAFAAAILVVGPGAGHAAQADAWNTPYDRLFDQPGAEVSNDVNDKGQEERKLIIPGKTMIIQRRDGGKVRTIVSDLSGLGAVLCTWMIFRDTRAALEVKGGDTHPAAVKRLDSGLHRLNEFIAENSIEHRTVGDLEKAYRARLEKIRQDGSAPKILDGFAALVTGLEKEPQEKFEAGLDKFLSVPRLPAMDPCL